MPKKSKKINQGKRDIRVAGGAWSASQILWGGILAASGVGTIPGVFLIGSGVKGLVYAASSEDESFKTTTWLINSAEGGTVAVATNGAQAALNNPMVTGAAKNLSTLYADAALNNKAAPSLGDIIHSTVTGASNGLICDVVSSQVGQATNSAAEFCRSMGDGGSFPESVRDIMVQTVSGAASGSATAAGSRVLDNAMNKRKLSTGVREAAQSGAIVGGIIGFSKAALSYGKDGDTGAAREQYEAEKSKFNAELSRMKERYWKLYHEAQRHSFTGNTGFTIDGEKVSPTQAAEAFMEGKTVSFFGRYEDGSTIKFEETNPHFKENLEAAKNQVDSVLQKRLENTSIDIATACQQVSQPQSSCNESRNRRNQPHPNIPQPAQPQRGQLQPPNPEARDEIVANASAQAIGDDDNADLEQIASGSLNGDLDWVDNLIAVNLSDLMGPSDATLATVREDKHKDKQAVKDGAYPNLFVLFKVKKSKFTLERGCNVIWLIHSSSDSKFGPNVAALLFYQMVSFLTQGVSSKIEERARHILRDTYSVKLKF